MALHKCLDEIKSKCPNFQDYVQTLPDHSQLPAQGILVGDGVGTGSMATSTQNVFQLCPRENTHQNFVGEKRHNFSRLSQFFYMAPGNFLQKLAPLVMVFPERGVGVGTLLWQGAEKWAIFAPKNVSNSLESKPRFFPTDRVSSWCWYSAPRM